MRIDAIEIFHLGLPVKRPLPGFSEKRPLPGPASQDARLETIVLRMESGGVSGWSEASPGAAPLYSAEWAAGVFGCLRDWLAPAVAGETLDAEQLTAKLEPFRGNQHAKAAIEMAWRDLDARLSGVSLPKMLGAVRNAVELGATFDRMDSHEAFLNGIQAAFEAGYVRVKLKMRPGWDIRMLEAVRREFPSQDFLVDVEGGLTLGHSEILYRLDDFCLQAVEQPLSEEEIVGHAMLHESLRTPIALDEGIRSLLQADMAIDLQSCQVINLKPGRVGGLAAALAIHDLAHEHCVSCYVGAVPQTSLGARFGLALAGKANCQMPADYFPAGEYLAEDIVPPPVLVRDQADGKLRASLWEEPGVGVEPDRAVLERHSLQQVRI